jgi:hypothetical protein
MGCGASAESPKKYASEAPAPEAKPPVAKEAAPAAADTNGAAATAPPAEKKPSTRRSVSFQPSVDVVEVAEGAHDESGVAENTPHIHNKLKGKDTYTPAEAEAMLAADRPSVSGADSQTDLGTSVGSVRSTGSVSLAEKDGTSAKRLSNVGQALDLRVLEKDIPPLSPDADDDKEDFEPAPDAAAEEAAPAAEAPPAEDTPAA